MNVFDIIGPVMVGPSSSHTAGAVRLGNMALAILGCPVASAVIGLHGSFAKTGRGHGTDLALVAGLMGWPPDDLRIPQSFEYAKKIGLIYSFVHTDMGETAHPNLAKFELVGANNTRCTVLGASIGGGRIVVQEVDGFPLEFGGDYPTLLITNDDVPGTMAKVTGILAKTDINIAQMKVFRQLKGGLACSVLETDQPIGDEDLKLIAALPMVHSVRMIGAVG